MVSCGTFAVVVGSEPPAMSVAFTDGRDGFRGFSLFFSDFDLDLRAGRPQALADFHGHDPLVSPNHSAGGSVLVFSKAWSCARCWGQKWNVRVSISSSPRR